MKKHLFAVLAVIASGMSVMAQNAVLTDSVSNDSIDRLMDRFVNLEELTVTGASVINKSDRKWIVPSAESKRLASDGSDLVRKMQLPDVKVDAVSGAITMFSQGALKLCINGRPVTDKEVKALDPKTVERVEYHDNPSLRFGSADLVLDFIVKVPNSGGRFGMMGQIVPLKGTEFQVRPNLEVNYKKSTFRFNGSTEQLYGFKQWRENYENYTLADGSTFTRTESGEPAKIEKKSYWGNVEYMYFDPEKDLFSAEVSISGEHNPNSDFIGTLSNSLDGSKVKLEDLNYASEYYPSLNLYYQHNLAKNKLLMFNVWTNRSGSHSRRHYMESDATDDRNGEIITDVLNDIRTQGNSLYAEAAYEQQWRNSRLNAGASTTYDWNKNRYLSYSQVERMRNSSTYVYASWWQRISSHIDASVGVGAYYRSYEIVDNDKTSNWTFAPRVNVRYRINNYNTLRLIYKMNGTAPTLSQLSSVRQQVDGLQQSVGNISLNTYSTHAIRLSYEYIKNRFYGQLQLNYGYQSKPIWVQKSWVDGTLLSTYANQRNLQALQAKVTANYEVVPEWVSASGSLSWDRYMAHGNNYNHTLSRVRSNMSVEVTHWNFGLQFQLETFGRELKGETISQTGSNGMVLAASYRYRNFNFVTACINPFTGDYKEESADLNALAGYKRASHLNFLSKCVIFQVHYNISWGRKYQNGSRRINGSSDHGKVSAAGK